ncbi:MAG: hypothetical protein AAF824_24675, partial [Bacteroidota bacterium]
GDTPFFVRLPNVLAHLLYLIFSTLLIRKLSPNGWVVLAGFLMLNANPYLLDFFSVARGYGLACAFMMMSLYYLHAFIVKPTNRSIVLAILGAILAVLSNFTFLNYLAILFAIFISFGFFSHFEKMNLPPLTHQQLGLLIGVIIVSTFSLGYLLIVPVQTLSQLAEFNFGAPTLHATYRAIILDSLYGQGYFSGSTPDIFAVSCGIIGIISLVVGFSKIKQLGQGHARWYVTVCLLLILLILALLTQFYLLGTQYLVNRKALIIIILLTLPVISLIETLRNWRISIGLGFSLFISLFFFLHFSRTASSDLIREWYYDRYNQQITQLVAAESVGGRETKLGLEWIFIHSFLFYQQTGGLENVAPLQFDPAVRSDTLYEYYYIQPSQAHLLHPNYRLVKQFGKVTALYKRTN